MTEVVSARLHALDSSLRLSRSAGPGNPAALVIPRGGPFREPRLVLLARPYGSADVPGRRLVRDDHVVAAYGDEGLRELADVVLTAGPVAAALARLPGAEVAVGRRGAVGFRDGTRLTATAAVGRADPSLIGSFLHCWHVAGLSPEALAGCVVLVGTVAGEAMAVTGRLAVRPEPPARRGRAAS